MKNYFLMFLSGLAALFLCAGAEAGYEEGLEARKKGDYAEALHQWLVASDDPRCMTAIGVMYDYGEGLPRDVDKAAGWYKKAADRGEYRAIAQLASFSLNGAGNIDPDPTEWRKKLEAIEGRDDYADSILAYFYMDGYGGAKNLEKASALLTALVQKGYTQLDAVAQQAAKRLADQKAGVVEVDALTAEMARGAASFDLKYRDRRIVLSGWVVSVDRLSNRGYVVKFGTSTVPSPSPKDNILAIFYDPSRTEGVASLKPGMFVKLDGVYVGQHPFPLDDCAFTLFGCSLLDVAPGDIRP